MATTAETYRIGGRNTRNTTNLNTFANGMYLTEQVLPEGYAKTLVNYDIADTGSNIHPKYGRDVYETLEYNSSWLAGLSLTDYMYEYDSTTDEVVATQDTLISFGQPVTPEMLGADPSVIADNSYFYLCSIRDVLDGELLDKPYSPGWGLIFDENTSHFHTADVSNLGGITARTLKNATQHSIQVTNINDQTRNLFRPVYTILENELYAFSFDKITRTQITGETTRLNKETKPNLSKIKIVNNNGKYSLSREVIEPMNLNPYKAVNSGFNMLSPTPYSFKDESNVDVTLTGLMAYLDDSWAVPTLNHQIGEDILFRIYYGYPDYNVDMRYKIEVYESGDVISDADVEWRVVQDWTKVNFPTNKDDPAPVLKFTFKPEYSISTLRVTVRRGEESESERAMTYAIYTTSSRTKSTDFKVFDLTKAKGMISWVGYIGLYGIPGAENVIMWSDIVNPSYFPYPGNVLEFDNNILAVYNYLDNLLVVTVDSIWLVQLGLTISASLKTRVLANIYISELDALNMQILKDEIFFKTDDEFYVLKPNKYTADSTNLKSYSNSIAVAELTSNFKNAVLTIMNDTYRHLFRRYQYEDYNEIDGKFTDFVLHDVYSVLRNNEVFYTYIMTPNYQTRLKNGDELVNQGFADVMQFSLVYNTTTRSWRIYMEGIGDSAVTGYTPLLYKGKQTGSFYQIFGNKDKVILAKQVYDKHSNRIDVGDWSAGSVFENFQFINTGSITLDDTFTKRFREVQFNILNKEKVQLEYKTEFLLDGQTRVDYTNYLTQHITDINDPDYGHIFVTPIESDNMYVAGKTTLDFWNLDFSKFPELAVATVRFQLQGRGRRGQLKLLCTSLKDYELANICWVYRTMSAR